MEQTICSKTCPNNYVLEIKYHPKDVCFSMDIKKF